MPVDLTIVESTTELGQTVVEVILEGASEPGPAGAGVPTGGTAGQVLTKDSGTDFDTSWQDSAGGGGGAPTDVDYLVGTASGDLSAEIVVGTSPGGELGGTWASPTVDAVHSGSSHAAVQAAAEATAAAALSSHESDTTNVHGIADTTVLATDAELAAHAADTTSVHGIADTSALLDTADIGSSVQAHDADLAAIAALTTTAFGRALLELANQAALLSAAGAAAASHAHAGEDVTSGTVADARIASTIARDTEVILQTLADAKGDLVAASAADTFARLPVGTDGQVLTADSGETTGLAWAAAGGGTEHAIVRKTATESVTTSTTLQDDNELLFAIGANEVWAVTFLLYVDGATSGDIKTAVKAPTGSSGRFGTRGPGSGATAFDNHSVRNEADTPVSDTPTAVGSGTLGTGNVTALQIDALVVNGSTAGNVVLQWAQSNSSGTATRVFVDSYLIAHRIA